MDTIVELLNKRDYFSAAEELSKMKGQMLINTFRKIKQDFGDDVIKHLLEELVEEFKGNAMEIIQKIGSLIPEHIRKKLEAELY